MCLGNLPIGSLNCSNTDWHSLMNHNFLVYVAQIHTIYMFSISSIFSHEDNCTPILDIYLAPLVLMLTMTAVYDGQSLNPRGGCVISPPGDKKWISVVVCHGVRGIPITIVRFMELSKYDTSGKALILLSFTLTLAWILIKWQGGLSCCTYFNMIFA